ncbi:MAG: helix-turn-helix domain-containing protein [Bacteroidota bacterium]
MLYRIQHTSAIISNTITALNINKIADQTGFESISYFSKLFKKKNGVSPNMFRKTLMRIITFKKEPW